MSPTVAFTSLLFCLFNRPDVFVNLLCHQICPKHITVDLLAGLYKIVRKCIYVWVPEPFGGRVPPKSVTIRRKRYDIK